MKNFAFTVMSASLVGGIVSSLVSNRSKLKKYVGFVVTIVCTLSLLQPLGKVISSATELKNAASSFLDDISYQNKINSTNDIIISTSKARIEKGIKELIIDKYKFDENEVTVELILNNENVDSIKIEKINVYITGKATWSDADTIEKYLKEVLGSEVLVKRR